MKFIVIALVATFLAQQAIAKPRIVGGEEARVAQFPYAVAITATASGYKHFCGGSLISDQYILTAAQCVNTATSFTIQLGSNTLDGSDINRKTVATSNKIVHPDYDARTLEHDIALLKLHQPIMMTDYIKIVRLPTSDVVENSQVTIIGWGQVDDTHPGVSNNLLFAQLTSISNTECQITYGNQLVDSMVCLAGNFNEGNCLDDTGSPAVTTFFGIHWVVGVSTFYSGNGCESTDPAGYTRVYPHVDWINEIIVTPSK